MKILLPLLVIPFLFSCISQKKIMDSWLGAHKSMLIQKWGPPEHIASDGMDGEVFMYSQLIQTPPMAGFTTPGYTSPKTPGQIFYKLKMFYVSKDGYIYRWLIQTSRVPPQQVRVDLYIH